MAKTEIESSFIPFQYVAIPNDGETLKIYFTTKDEPPTDVQCGRIIYLNCHAKGIPNVDTITIRWKTDCGEYRTVLDTDDDETIDITYTEDEDNLVTEIQVVIDIAELSNKNQFYLFASVENEPDVISQLPLSRGVVYTEI